MTVSTVKKTDFHITMFPCWFLLFTFPSDNFWTCQTELCMITLPQLCFLICIQYCEKYLPLCWSYFFFYCFVIFCHLCRFQIIKRIVILDKDNTGKHKKQFLNDYFIFWEKKAIQTHLEPIWKKKSHKKETGQKRHPWESKNNCWPKRAQKLVSYLLKKTHLDSQILVPNKGFWNFL